MIRSTAPGRDVAAALVGIALALAACGSEPTSSEMTPSPGISPTDSPGEVTPAQTATSPESATSPTDGDAASSAGEPDDASLPEPAEVATASDGFPDMTGPTSYLSSVEIGDHAEYERVVFTFVEDAEVPAWQVEYVDEVREDGSGRLVEVAGDAALAVTLSGASGVDMTGETFEKVYTGPDQLDGADAGTSSILEVVNTGDFEAVMSWAIGVDEQQPFRAFTLTDPPRLAVDVATS